MAQLLLQRDATVTICHSRTRDLAAVTSTADLLVVAIGRAGFIRREHIKPGAIVIDVGMNRVSDPDEVRDAVWRAKLRTTGGGSQTWGDIGWRRESVRGRRGRRDVDAGAGRCGFINCSDVDEEHVEGCSFATTVIYVTCRTDRIDRCW